MCRWHKLAAKEAATNSVTGWTMRRSSLVTGFMVAAMAFQSPVGHDALYQGLLRVWLSKTWLQASIDTGRPISFQTLRDNAKLLAYDPDADIFLNNIRLLKDNASFCLPPIDKDDEDDPDVPQKFFACHAYTSRDDKKRNDGLKNKSLG